MVSDFLIPQNAFHWKNSSGKNFGIIVFLDFQGEKGGL